MKIKYKFDCTSCPIKTDFRNAFVSNWGCKPSFKFWESPKSTWGTLCNCVRNGTCCRICTWKAWVSNIGAILIDGTSWTWHKEETANTKSKKSKLFRQHPQLQFLYFTFFNIFDLTIFRYFLLYGFDPVQKGQWLFKLSGKKSSQVWCSYPQLQGYRRLIRNHKRHWALPIGGLPLSAAMPICQHVIENLQLSVKIIAFCIIKQSPCKDLNQVLWEFELDDSQALYHLSHHNR